MSDPSMTGGLVERLRSGQSLADFWSNRTERLLDEAASLLTKQAEDIERLTRELAAIDRLVSENIHDNGSEINRMKVGDEWHTGPVVDAAFRIIKGLGQIARNALVTP